VKLKDALDKASPMPLQATHLAPHLRPTINGADGSLVAEFEHVSDFSKAPVNAALLAHTLSHFQEMVDMLEWIVSFRDPEVFDTQHVIDDEPLKKAEELLKMVKEVKI